MVWRIFKCMINADTLFKLLADQTRLRALVLLQNHGELCVCELTHALGISQPKISRHLAHLRDAKLVTDKRQGLWVYYQINRDIPAWVLDILKISSDEVTDKTPFSQDQAALLSMANRPGTSCCA